MTAVFWKACHHSLQLKQAKVGIYLRAETLNIALTSVSEIIAVLGYKEVCAMGVLQHLIPDEETKTGAC